MFLTQFIELKKLLKYGYKQKRITSLWCNKSSCKCLHHATLFLRIKAYNVCKCIHLVINCQDTTYRFNKGNSLSCGLRQVSIKHLFVSYDSQSCLNYLAMKIPVKDCSLFFFLLFRFRLSMKLFSFLIFL